MNASHLIIKFLVFLFPILTATVKSAGGVIFFLLVLVVQLDSISIGAVREERYCLEQYGDEYRVYLDRTPRWIGIPKY